MAGSTLTTTGTSIPATRGRPLSFDLELEDLDLANPVDPDALLVEAFVAWPNHKVPGLVDRSEVPWVVSWTAESLYNLPSSPPPHILVTLVEESGTTHDFLIPVEPGLVPL